VAILAPRHERSSDIKPRTVLNTGTNNRTDKTVGTHFIFVEKNFLSFYFTVKHMPSTKIFKPILGLSQSVTQAIN
jgi:hypothetical protein